MSFDPIRMPQLQELAVRVIFAVLGVASFTLLGLWASATNVFSWMATCFSLVVLLFARDIFRDTAIVASIERGPGRGLLAILREHPVLRLLATDRAARWLAVVLAAMAVATVEQIVAGLLLSRSAWPSATKEGVALALILLPLYYIVEIFLKRSQRQEWLDHLLDEVMRLLKIDFAKLDRRVLAARNAVVRTSIALLTRTILITAIPMLFSTPLGTACFVVLAVFLLVAWDTIAQIAIRLNEARSTKPASDGSSERQAS